MLYKASPQYLGVRLMFAKVWQAIRSEKKLKQKNAELFNGEI